MRSKLGAGRLLVVAVAVAWAIAGCGSSSPTGSAGPANTNLPGGSGSQKVGVFKIKFAVTGYYNVAGQNTAAGNGLTCAQMAANGTSAGGGFNTWDTPWGATVTASGHSIQDMSTLVDNFRTKPGNTTVHFTNVQESADIEIDNNIFDASGEGGSDSVTVNGDGSGSFDFQNAPDQNLGTSSGQMATVSGRLTWTCTDVPPSQAPSGSS
jgi:hypothetical protein